MIKQRIELTNEQFDLLYSDMHADKIAGRIMAHMLREFCAEQAIATKKAWECAYRIAGESPEDPTISLEIDWASRCILVRERSVENEAESNDYH